MNQLTNRAAVLGHPIAHSLSPVLHRTAYEYLGLPWRYDAIDMTAEELPGFVAHLGPEWRGLSLTMPLKHAILPLLDVVDPVAAKVGAVNTVVFQAEQRLGFNTDVLGLSQALNEGNIDRRQFALVLGAGATASSTIAALADLHVTQIGVCARRPQAVEGALALAQSLNLDAVAIAWEDRFEAMRLSTVISTLPGDAAAELSVAVPKDPGLFLDLTYSPWPTTLAKAWQQRGGTVVGGFRVLLWQAAAQVELMTGLSAPVLAMAQAGNDALIANS